MWQNIDLQWFAAEDEGRTEEATEHRISEARKEGRVAKSQEINSASVLLIAILTLVITARRIFRLCREVLVFYFVRSTSFEPDSAFFAMGFFNYFIKIVMPVALAGASAAIIANIIQNRGVLWTFKPIQPQFSKIVPNFGRYFKRTLFSLEGLWNVGKSLLKVGLIAVIAYFFIRRDLPKILELLNAASVNLAAFRIAKMVSQLLITVAVIMIVIAIPDYVVQRHQHLESLKMTKQEVKQEFKEMEGDPEMKGRLEQAQRDLLSRNIPKAVRESDVVITNPTHFAVALKYDSAVADSPIVNAKGEDELAFRIKSIARENDIPIVENRPLARELYTSCEIGAIIPESYIRAIVAVYTSIGYDPRKNK